MGFIYDINREHACIRVKIYILLYMLITNDYRNNVT